MTTSSSLSKASISKERLSRPGLELPGAGPFESEKWLKYFEENKKLRSSIRLPAKIDLSEEIKAPLLRSLQRFQIGETGDGRHLRRYAEKTKDLSYMRCVDLFVKEEQSHGQILAEIISAIEGTLLSWHWSDLAFIALRRLLGLKTEIFIILIAEIIGKCFYRSIADKIENQSICNAFAFIVCDEIAHLRFHSEFLNRKLATYPALLKLAIRYAWTLIFLSACFVFVIDHKAALKALGTNPGEFIDKCTIEFQRSAKLVFSGD